MSSSDTPSESESQHTFSSECRSDYEVDEDVEPHDQSAEEHVSEDDDGNAYQDEPLADDDWIKKYYDRLRQTEELENDLQKRLNGTTATSEW